MINWYVKIFPCLLSLCLVQSVSDNQYSMAYATHQLLCRLIFGTKFTELIDIALMTNEGVILNKQLCPNKLLKRLTILLRTIDDLLVLLDGLVPNLTELHITLCTTRASRQILLPFEWSNFPMSYLTKFRLTTNENVEMRSEYLFPIVKLLTQLNTFTLDVKRWTSKDNTMSVCSNVRELIVDVPCSDLTRRSPNINTLAVLCKCKLDACNFPRLRRLITTNIEVV